MITALRAAIGMLTVLPGGVALDRRSAPAAMIMAPLAVIPVAAVAAAGCWLAQLVGIPATAAGLIAVAFTTLGTRALHLDGLADTVDAFGSGWDRERALTIMRRGDIGPMGVIALIIVIGLQAACFGALAGDLLGAIAVAVIICSSRAVLVIACSRPVPPARPEGLGALVAASVPLPVTVAVVVIMVVLDVFVTAPLAGRSGITGAVAGVAAYGCGLLVVRHAVRRFGGITGDVLGAVVELTATVLAVGMLLQIPPG
jgi:adenosylcobinamide-GDP ribazoletransferase